MRAFAGDWLLQGASIGAFAGDRRKFGPGPCLRCVGVETIAPDSKAPRTVLSVFAGLTILGAVLTFVGFPERGGSPAAVRPLAYGVVMLVLGVLGSGYSWLWRRNARLLVGVDRFGHRDAFGRDHVWSRSEVARIVDVS